jgi:hypothetical protein
MLTKQRMRRKARRKLRGKSGINSGLPVMSMYRQLKLEQGAGSPLEWMRPFCTKFKLLRGSVAKGPAPVAQLP